MGSQATRECDGVLYTRAGLEIGVAATKTFVAQLALVYLLALRLAELRGSLSAARIGELVAAMRQLPQLIDELLDGSTSGLTRSSSGAGRRTSSSISVAMPGCRSPSRAH